MKVLLIVLDGLADISHPQLKWKTPLQTARTPVMDRLAEEGSCALMFPLAPGVCPSSELAHWSMFGYPLEEFPGRAYFHALAAGIPLREGDALFMFNLVPVRKEKGEVYVLEADRLHVEKVDEGRAQKLKDSAPQGIKVYYLGGIEFIAVVNKGSPHLRPTDPFLHHLPVAELKVSPGWEEDENTLRTLGLLREFKEKAEEVLTDEGETDVRELGLIMKWPSWAGRVPSFREKYGMKGAAVVSTPCFRGIGMCLGMRVIDVGEKEAGADLNTKLDMAEEWLRGEGDFVFVHTKHADEAAHTGDPSFKVEVIEALDEALAKHYQFMSWENLVTVITTDHSTPTTRDPRVIHGGDPVPVLFHAATLRRDSVRFFDEVSAASGGMGQLNGRDLMPLILYLSRRATFTSWLEVGSQALFLPRYESTE